jgi:hypothetical protein
MRKVKVVLLNFVNPSTGQAGEIARVFENAGYDIAENGNVVISNGDEDLVVFRNYVSVEFISNIEPINKKLIS